MNDRRFAISMHILVLLSLNQDEWLSSDFIASSININPVLVRKELSNLRKNGIILSKEGKNGGSMLAKSPESVYLSDVYRILNCGAILGYALAAPNPKCPVGRQINEHLRSLAIQSENILLANLGTKTLAEFSKNFL